MFTEKNTVADMDTSTLASDKSELPVTSDPEPWQPPLFSSTTWVLIISALVIFCVYDHWRHQYFNRRGIPSIWAKPLIGNTMDFFLDKKGIFGFHDRCFAKGDKTIGFYLGWRPAILTADVDMVRQICIKDFSSFTNRQINRLDNKPFDKGLISLEGDHWRDVRGMLSPTFSGSKMKLVTPLISQSLEATIRKVNKHHEEGKSIQCKDVYGGFLLDATASCAFGLDINCQENEDDPFVSYAKSLFKVRFTFTVLVLIFLPFLIPVLNYFNMTTFDKKTLNYFQQVLDQAIEMRKDKKNKRMDFLQMMLDTRKETTEEDKAEATEVEKQEQEHRKKSGKKSLTMDEIVAQGLNFFLAGFGTSGDVLALTSYLLATNPDIQDKLAAEIDEIVPRHGDVKYEMLSKMTYLEQVLNESMRLFPAAPVLTRVAGNDYEYKGIKIDKNSEVHFSVWHIHYDPEIWDEPEVFNPDRFSPEEKEKRHSCAYMPFGIGPRNCIGMRFALLQVKLCLIRMIQNFRLETCSETEIPPVLGRFGLTSPPNGVKLNAIPRS